MRKVLFWALLTTLCVILISASFVPVMAKRGMVFVGSFAGAPVIEHPDMMMEFLEFRSSPCGKADVLMISMLMDGTEAPILAVTDNAEFSALLDQVFGGMVPVVTVGEEELEVWRHGRTLIGELTVQVGDLHPVRAEFKGSSGKPVIDEETETIPGYTITLSYIAFSAIATFTSDGTQCQQTIGMMGPQFMMRIVPA